MFQHFLITRFNLRKSGWQNSKSHSKVLTDQWMQDRLRLFESYCFPSVKAQTVQDFTWLVFFDTTTPEPFRQRIADLADDFPAFTPVFVEGMGAFFEAIMPEIKRRSNESHVITSRLDNDDCLHCDYVAEVQSHFCGQKFMAIDLVDGYTLQVDPQVRFAKRSHVHNPFLSLIEDGRNAKSIWQIERHGQWSKVKEVKPVRGKRLWMSIIHKENKANVFEGFDDVDWSLIDDFNIEPMLKLNLSDNRVAYSSWRIQGLVNKFRTMWKVNFKLIKRKLGIVG